jgi:hypothetical protein
MGSGGTVPPPLISAVDEDEWSAFRPGRFVIGEMSRYPLDGRLVGPHKRIENCEEYLTPAGNRTSAIQPATRLHTN